jgi:hypothetical protein
MNWSITSQENAKKVLLGRSLISLFEKMNNLKNGIPRRFLFLGLCSDAPGHL